MHSFENPTLDRPPGRSLGQFVQHKFLLTNYYFSVCQVSRLHSVRSVDRAVDLPPHVIDCPIDRHAVSFSCMLCTPPCLTLATSSRVLSSRAAAGLSLLSPMRVRKLQFVSSPHNFWPTGLLSFIIKFAYVKRILSMNMALIHRGLRGTNHHKYL